MMGRQSRQMAMVFVDMESLIPENHLLRKIDRMVSFDFIYELLAPYYSATSRPSRLAVRLSILSVCLKCFWSDICTGSNQNGVW